MNRLISGLNITYSALSSSAFVRQLCSHRSLCHLPSSSIVARHTQPRQPVFRLCQSFSYSVSSEPFLDGTSAVYVEELYENWLQNPTSVHKVSSNSDANYSSQGIALYRTSQLICGPVCSIVHCICRPRPTSVSFNNIYHRHFQTRHRKLAL